MSSKSTASLFWRATLLLAIFMGSNAFNLPTQTISPAPKMTCFRQAALPSSCANAKKSLLHSLRVTNTAADFDKASKRKKYVQVWDNKNLPLMQSISVVVASRRLSFLVLSILIVNFVCSKILKIPKSEKFMFDECPWPFTAAHDPIKFIKDRNTHIVAVWALLCQLYSLLKQAPVVA